MPIEHGPTTLQVTRIPQDTRISPFSKQPVPMSWAGGATTPRHAQFSKSGSV